MGRKKNTRKLELKEVIFLVICVVIIEVFAHIVNNTDYANDKEANNVNENQIPVSTVSFNLETIPRFTDKPYVAIDNNVPGFKEEEYVTKPFETYSELDSLGRCGVAYANICKDIMPANGEERQAINMIKPSGWQKTKYEGLVEGNYLYNRCHLIGYQLTGENANPKNLITCTRTMNAKTMLEYENQVANYIRKTHNHVLYRVTPIFKDNNMLATGVEIEAESIEDNGKGIRFNVFLYNVEDHVEINYLDGSNKLK